MNKPVLFVDFDADIIFSIMERMYKQEKFCFQNNATHHLYIIVFAIGVEQICQIKILAGG